MRAVSVVLLLAGLLLQGAVCAQDADEAGTRGARLAEQLRCLVCQNQSIADSNAELAVDLRRQISEQIAAGRTDSQITDFMVERYGDFVLYNPPVKTTTILLWAGPLLLLALAAFALLRILRQRRATVPPAPLTGEQRRTVAQLLGADEESRTR